MNMAPVAQKFRAFGWATEEIDGHDMAQILEVLARVPLAAGQPSAIIAHTVKAKGIAMLEDTVASHYWRPTQAELDAAIQEVEAQITALQMEAPR